MNKVKAFIATEVRIYEVGGHFYADASFARIIERYSKNIDEVVLATRIIKSTKIKDGYKKIDGYCCGFYSIGSIPEFLVKRVSNDIKDSIKESDLVILRLPSLASSKLYSLARKQSKTLLVEVMGCAWDAYWNHGVVGKIIAPFLFFYTKKMVRNANYCIYVTNEFLQKRYPHKDKKNTIALSNVDISSLGSPKSYNSFDAKNFTLMTAAALNVKYKGQQFVIKAISELKRKHGINVTYYLAGKGDSKWLKNLAEKYKVEGSIKILGMMPKEELHKKMREVDFYIQPSLQEGLPRSLIEAMSQGTVCFGSNVAGIPELLNKKQIFKGGSVPSIITTVLNTIDLNHFSTISEQGIETARLYSTDALDRRRHDFFRRVINDIKVGR